MDTNDTGQFVLGTDETLSGSETYQEQSRSKSLEKLSLKVTLISVLIPSIAAILVIFLYVDMRSKLNQIKSSGSVEMGRVAEELRGDLATFKQDNLEFEKRLDERIAALNATFAPIQDRLSRTEKQAEALAKSKADNVKVTTELDKIRTETVALKKETSSLTSQAVKLSSLIEDAQKKTLDIPAIKSSSDALKKSNEALKQDIAKLKADMIDKTELESEIKKQKVFYQLEVQELSNKFDKKIQALKSEARAPAAESGPARP